MWFSQRAEPLKTLLMKATADKGQRKQRVCRFACNRQQELIRGECTLSQVLRRTIRTITTVMVSLSYLIR